VDVGNRECAPRVGSTRTDPNLACPAGYACNGFVEGVSLGRCEDEHSLCGKPWSSAAARGAAVRVARGAATDAPTTPANPAGGGGGSSGTDSLGVVAIVAWVCVGGVGLLLVVVITGHCLGCCTPKGLADEPIFGAAWEAAHGSGAHRI